MKRLVAEALPRPQRLRLLVGLWRRGFTDDQIADALAYTTYTTARIRASLDLPPNPRSAPQWQPGHSSTHRPPSAAAPR